MLFYRFLNCFNQLDVNDALGFCACLLLVFRELLLSECQMFAFTSKKCRNVHMDDGVFYMIVPCVLWNTLEYHVNIYIYIFIMSYIKLPSNTMIVSCFYLLVFDMIYRPIGLRAWAILCFWEKEFKPVVLRSQTGFQ